MVNPYLGPNTVMPLASLLAAILGIVLIFWRFISGFFRKAFRKLFRKKDAAEMIEPVDDTRNPLDKP